MAQGSGEKLRRKWKEDGLLLDDEWVEVTEELLGSGGSAEVFRGKLDGEDVAVKRYLNDKHVESMQREVELMRSLKHPNVLTIHGVAIVDDKYHVILPLSTNGNLSRFIHGSEQPPDEKLKMRIAQGICEGLSYLHSHGVVHGDLKPENILLDETYTPCISDFGLSQKVRPGSNVSARKGTYRYMAPEIVKQGAYSRRADVYSLGVLLCELFTGRVPYGEGNSRRLAMAASYKTLRPNLHGIASPVMAALIEECWNSDPARRPTMKAVLKDVKKLGAENHRGRPWMSSFLRSTKVGV
uniref:Protein kinase domain-containing protein n=1 Tax=Rhodosorus marinus TaxID=101924 RepID=A0A7S2ZRX9_9RHOD|mmetsp:Transcript_30519/g.116789  ORF Transcript_30519/g.116789 Transcript_30519/m.116789 type:complete len:297 (+) Transcript_30519:224-1114(+)|eukprot:CAMPEP_0113962332 /NCGR_PEP_ID=MMETSP0011_2-20120614/5853_1 /TAXON_ID=101924 /ORGANISM="Rhodosorus marinus" /LENGTH=296 /DNA_ID=CAMNT_0000974167 /DNA_START=126 /DNA_END=1016 /DNA_ORIENTATION=+ /assembly_acc=CAM_ASM_000156